MQRRLNKFGRLPSEGTAILEAALLSQRLKLVVLLCRLLRRVTRFGFMRFLGALFVNRLLLGFFIEHDALAGFVFHIDLMTMLISRFKTPAAIIEMAGKGILDFRRAAMD
jgi:hypothetical protein